MIGAGIALGNALGFIRAAVTAYLLGTHAAADAWAVAIGPIDTLNSTLINTIIFAFVPMLVQREGAARFALLRQGTRLFMALFGCLSLAIILLAPWLARVLGPGLQPSYYPAAVNILRITALSTLAAGFSAIQAAQLYSERRFGPSAFYQASLNAFTIAGALALWRYLGIYSFAIGYACGAGAQCLLVYRFARNSRTERFDKIGDTPWRELLAKPGSFLAYAVLIALNVIVTRAYATHAGPGMAAAFDYCIRCVNVVIAYLVSPVSNSLLPEIARLHRENRFRDAFRIVDRTVSLAALAAVAACAVGIALRQPVISLLFERGNFTADSTRLVSGVFLGFAPALIGLSLLELMSRSLFALNRPWLPVACATIPVLFNLTLSAVLRSVDPARYSRPEWIGVGASAGLLLACLTLFTLTYLRRNRWMANSEVPIPEPEFSEART